MVNFIIKEKYSSIIFLDKFLGYVLRICFKVNVKVIDWVHGYFVRLTASLNLKFKFKFKI
jgi:hypothetical protein